MSKSVVVTDSGDHTRVEVPRGPAPFSLRLIAGMIDLAVVCAPALVGIVIVYSLRDANGGGQAGRFVFGLAAALATVATLVWNIGYAQGRRGVSVGKNWCGLVARGPNGKPLGVQASLLFARREVVRRATALAEGFTEIEPDASPHSLRIRRLVGLLACVLLLGVVLLASLAVGAKPLSLAEIGNAIVPPYDHNPTDVDHIVRNLRFPRTLLGLVTGMALGMAGGLIQGHTRNPLADPGILGINAGAALPVVLAIMLLGISSPLGYVWFALGGALVTCAMVFGLSTMGSRTFSPTSLVIGGAAMAAFLTSITSAVILLNQSTLNIFRFWVVGSVSGRGLDVLVLLAPFFAVGFLIALVSAPGLNLLSLGEDVARSLGANIALNRIVGVAGIALLAGAATAACGPIAFLGLVVPHVARAVTGPDYRWILPYSALIGAIMLMICDVIGRVVVRPGELQVGIVLALVGGPFFVLLIRRRKLVTL